MNNPTCSRCHAEIRLVKISHTTKNPDRPFGICPNQHFNWLDTDAKYGHTSAVDVAVKSQPVNKTENKQTNDLTVTLAAEESSDDPLAFLDTKPVEVAPPPKVFIPSKYQEAVFDFVKHADGDAVIEAVAGSGKTTTIVKALDFTPKDAEVAFVAFNKSIANELARRAPEHIHVSTLHSLGYKNVRQQFPKAQVEERKLWTLFNDQYEYNYDLKDSVSEILRLVSLCKNTLSPTTPESLDALCDHYGVILNGNREEAFEAVAKLYEYSLKSVSTMIDYDDMLLLPALGTVQSQQFDMVMQDEAQDANNAQRENVRRALKPGGRLIAVGDSRRAIYGWAGAGIDSIECIINDFDASTLPLSISYRCPRKVIELAKQIVPQIEAREDAPDGIVRTINESQLTAQVKPGNMVLCRINAPLVAPAFELIRQGIKAVIRGRDIGKNLLSLVYKIQRRERLSSGDLNQIIVALSDYCSRESFKLAQAHKEAQADMLIDQRDTVIALSDGCKSIIDLERRIMQVFSDDVQGVVFSSCHKSKGLESDTVFILQPHLLNPQKWDKQDWQIKQCHNLKYVAYTRAKNELCFVEGGKDAQR